MSAITLVIALICFYRISRNSVFPNAWWFWFFATISFVQNSGIEFPISKFQFPAHPLTIASYFIGCGGAAISMLIGVTMFAVYVWTDLRSGRIAIDDD
jgi:hypothetical protein